MFFAGDLAGISVRAALHLRWAGLTGMLQRLIFCDALAGGATSGVGIVSAELLQGLILLADVLVVLGVPFKTGARPRAICVPRLTEHRSANIHLFDKPDKAMFQPRRDARDATLALPNLMLAGLQVNMRGGRAPAPEENGRSYLKLPLDYLEAQCGLSYL